MYNKSLHCNKLIWIFTLSGLIRCWNSEVVALGIIYFNFFKALHFSISYENIKFISVLTNEKTLIILILYKQMTILEF